jgi:uncharacterized membrane protein HdeD (DUF308 family)
MLETFTRNWWAVGLRGIFSVLFGVGAFVWPGITLETLVLLFGFYAIADGIFSLITARMSSAAGGHWGWMVFEVLLSILSGVLALAWPAITALVLLLLIAGYAIVTGFTQIAAAFQMRNTNGWLLGLGGVLSIVFGILLAVWPDTGLLSLVWLIGYYAIIFGLMLLGLAYRLYKANHQLRHLGGRLVA